MALPLLLLAVGTAIQAKASFDASAAQEEAGEVQQAEQRNRDAENLRKQARAATIQQAKIEQASEATGTSGSSRETSAVGSLSTQVASNAGRLAGQQNTAEVLSGFNQDIADAQVLSSVGKTVSSIGSYSFEESGGFDNLFKD